MMYSQQSAPWIRGNFIAFPDHEASSSVRVSLAVVDSKLVPCLMPLLYHPIRVLMSVLLTPAAATLINTYVALSSGRDKSVLYLSFSGPQWPVRIAPDILPGSGSAFIVLVVQRMSFMCRPKLSQPRLNRIVVRRSSGPRKAVIMTI